MTTDFQDISLDVQRMWDVLDGKIGGRAAGRTTALMHQAIGLAGTHGQNVWIQARSLEQTRILLDRMHQLRRYYLQFEFEFDSVRRVLRVGQGHIKVSRPPHDDRDARRMHIERRVGNFTAVFYD